MAAKIELEIVADNSQYINVTKQVEAATTSMQAKSEQSQKRQKDMINETANAYKTITNEKKKAFDTKPIDDHTKKTEATADALQNVGGAAGGAVGKVKSLGAAFKALLANPVALAIAAIVGALSGLVKLIKSTDSGANQLAARFAQIKAVLDIVRQRVLDFGGAIGDLFKGNFKAAAEGMKNSFAGIGAQMKTATAAAYDYIMALDAIEDAEANYVSKSAENRNKIAKLEFTAQDRRVATAERKKALQEALALGIEEVEAQKEFARKKLDAAIVALAQTNRVAEQELLAFIKMTDEERKTADVALLELYNRNEDKVNSIDQMYATWIDLDTRYYDENKRNLSRLSGFEEEINRDATEKKKKANEERLKNQAEFLKVSMALQDEYEKSQIKQLDGEDRINAEKAYQLKQIQLLEDHLKSLGTLTEAHYQYLDGLRADAELRSERAIRVEQQNTIDFWSDFYDEATNQRLKFLDFREELDMKAAELSGELTGKRELEIQRKWLQARIDLLKASKNPELLMQSELLDAELALIDKKLAGEEGRKTIWDVLGLGNSPEAQEAIKNGIKATTDALDEIFDARVEDAQRTRELLDTQISESQEALEAEVELAKLGYANNVDAKRKELAALKAEREKALREEEKAIKAQRTLDTIAQTSSLITASADIFKSMAKLGPIGIAVAIGTIATMFGAFIAAKTKAAGTTKLAKGGVGTVEGRSHSQGGEPFLQNVEVERGEMWGVLSQKATRKYGKAFNQVVTSFNKDQLPVRTETGDTSILVDVNQTNERLDKVEYQLIKMNKHFSRTRDVSETKDARIERIGRKTRIIRKNV